MRSQMSDVRRGDRHMKRKPMRAALWLLPLSSTFAFSQTSVNVLINRDDMGKYRSAADQVLQSRPGAVSDGLGAFATHVYFNQTVYCSGSRDSVQAFSLESGVFNPSPTAVSQAVFG